MNIPPHILTEAVFAFMTAKIEGAGECRDFAIEDGVRRALEKAFNLLNLMPWTPEEIDTGARAVVERIRIASRMAANGYDPRAPKLNVYAPMTDNDWRQFRNTPICAKSILDVNLIFKVLKRIPE